MIVYSLDKKDEHRRGLAQVLGQLVDDGAVSREGVSAGVLLFLDVFDDVAIDVPVAVRTLAYCICFCCYLPKDGPTD